MYYKKVAIRKGLRIINDFLSKYFIFIFAGQRDLDIAGAIRLALVCNRDWDDCRAQKLWSGKFFGLFQNFVSFLFLFWTLGRLFQYGFVFFCIFLHFKTLNCQSILHHYSSKYTMDKQENFQVQITFWGNTRYELYVSSQT